MNYPSPLRQFCYIYLPCNTPLKDHLHRITIQGYGRAVLLIAPVSGADQPV